MSNKHSIVNKSQKDLEFDLNNLIKKKKLVDEKIQDIIDEEKLYLER